MNSEEHNIETITDHLCSILKSKNSSYGNSVFTPPPFAPNVSPAEAILVRLGDKFKRLKSLVYKQGIGSVDETIADTILDIAGYCCLYLCYDVSMFKDEQDKE